MATKFTINGLTVEVSDPIEAATLLRALSTGAAQPHSAASVAANGPGPTPPPHSAATAANVATQRKNVAASRPTNGTITISQQSINDCYNFLCALREHPAGLSSDYITEFFKLADKRAFGSKITRFNIIMQQAGIKPDTVYDNPRGPDGRVVWMGRKNLNEAITAVRQMS